MKKICALLLIVLLAAPLLAQVETDARSLVLKNVSVIEMTGAPPKNGLTVVVKGNRIAAVGGAGKVRARRKMHKLLMRAANI